MPHRVGETPLAPTPECREARLANEIIVREIRHAAEGLEQHRSAKHFGELLHFRPGVGVADGIAGNDERVVGVRQQRRRLLDRGRITGEARCNMRDALRDDA
jgi:hypothetical protein